MESGRAKVLVVDDTPMNIKVLLDLLTVKGYEVITAESGPVALEKISSRKPEVVLLDVVMPEMDGYEVCRRVRANPETAVLPVVMITALDPTQERIKGLEAGADDFLTKPINQAELLARVRTLLRIKQLHDEVTLQAAQLAVWNKTLEERVREQVEQLERLARLKRFFSPQVAELILNGSEDPFMGHRRAVTVVFLDLRGFTAFAETAEPEEVMSVLREYHAEMGQLIQDHEGTLERFAGDGMMIFFNDPLEVPNPEERAIHMALTMRRRLEELHAKWLKLGYELDSGIGVATGYATIGVIGFEGRWDYGVIGTVSNLASRLCGEAKPGQILVPRRLFSSLEPMIEADLIGDLSLKGFHRPITCYNIVGLKSRPGSVDRAASVAI